MLITNKYENQCTKCKQTIPIEQQVEWTKGVGIAHVECPVPEDKFKSIRKYSYKKLQVLRKWQLCKEKFVKGDKYIYESYRLCQKCWEANLNYEGVS